MIEIPQILQYDILNSAPYHISIYYNFLSIYTFRSLKYSSFSCQIKTILFEKLIEQIRKKITFSIRLNCNYHTRYNYRSIGQPEIMIH